jgi:Tfp pilus assembly protein PilN
LENLPGLTRQFFVWEPDLKKFSVDACTDETLKMRRLHDPAASVSKHIGIFPYQINLVPLSILKNKKKVFIVRLIAFFLLVLALTSYPVAKLAGKKRALKNIQEKTFSLKKQAASMASLRKKNQNLLAGIQKLSEEIKNQVQVVELLKEITEITPKDAWLNSLFFSKKQVQLQGQAKSAIVIIEALENSPLFEKVHFDSHITKKNDLENFKIVAELE